jgi:hypothetical protein
VVCGIITAAGVDMAVTFQVLKICIVDIMTNLKKRELNWH